MLANSNIDITETLSVFRNKGLQVSFIVPTETGLKKSIMDATQPFRDFLSNTGIHNFDKQKQGTANKKIIETILNIKLTIPHLLFIHLFLPTMRLQKENGKM